MKKQIDRGPLGTRLAELREQAGLSLYELERRSGVNRPKLMRLETGQIRQPTPETLNKLALVFDIEPEELYDLASATGTLPSLPTYFRSKYGLTDKQIASLEKTVGRMAHTSSFEQPTKSTKNKKGGTS